MTQGGQNIRKSGSRNFATLFSFMAVKITRNLRKLHMYPSSLSLKSNLDKIELDATTINLSDTIISNEPADCRSGRRHGRDGRGGGRRGGGDGEGDAGADGEDGADDGGHDAIHHGEDKLHRVDEDLGDFPGNRL